MINYSKDNYLTPQKYIFSSIITEYDISKANINILKYKNMITPKEYEYAISLDKKSREIYIGLKQKNSNIANALQEGFAEFREKFITANNFTETDIISIKKDAIFILNKKAKIVNFDNIVFTEKNIYNSYMNLNRLEIYYGSDPINGTDKIDIKGISNELLPLHEDYMICFLCTVLDYIQSNSIKEVYEMILQFEKMYRNKELAVEFYREFNSDSMYRISINGTQYLLDTISNNEFYYLNISTNYKIIQEIYKLISNIYFNTISRNIKMPNFMI